MDNHKIHVLLVEDEATLGMIIKESLDTRNFIVTHCLNGQEAYNTYLEKKPDVLVLDIMMPKKNGYTLAQDIRKNDKITPIVFLSAKSQPQDVVDGFKAGGNDYLKKPFSMEELIVRIHALLSRFPQKTAENQFQIGKYVFNSTKQLLSYNTQTSSLTYRETAVLKLLLEHSNEVIDKSDVLLQIWGNDDFFNERSLYVFISKLRKKLDLDPSIQIINVKSIGYSLIC